MHTEALSLFGHATQSFDVDALAIPAKSFTGDFYFLDRCDEGLWFALGDVAGKGLNAAIMMAMIQEELENAIAVSRRGSGDPAAAMWRLDRAMHGILPSNRFATAVIGRIDNSGTMVLANAGHCPPLLVSGRKIESIGSTGPAIGILSRPAWSSTIRTVKAGDTLVLYTDGVIEATDAKGRELGADHLNAIVCEMRDETPRRITRAIADSVAGFAGAERQDDLTVLTIRM
ncbi:MAG: PP2C family protein-serine/threonine phosphatase [Thermoanaerobaculia bacterium]